MQKVYILICTKYCTYVFRSATHHSFFALYTPIITLKHVFCDAYICIIGVSCTAYSHISQEGRRIQVLAVNDIQKSKRYFFRPDDAQGAKQLSPFPVLFLNILDEYEATVFKYFLLYFNYEPQKRAIIRYSITLS